MTNVFTEIKRKQFENYKWIIIFNAKQDRNKKCNFIDSFFVEWSTKLKTFHIILIGILIIFNVILTMVYYFVLKM